MAALANERQISAAVPLAKRSRRFDSLQLPPDLARKMKLLRLALTLATPSNPAESQELTRIVASMEGTYGRGKYCPGGQGQCLTLEDLTRLMANSRDAKKTLNSWLGWHAIAPPTRKDFQRYVELANKETEVELLTRGPCGARNMTCLPTLSPRN